MKLRNRNCSSGEDSSKVPKCPALNVPQFLLKLCVETRARKRVYGPDVSQPPTFWACHGTALPYVLAYVTSQIDHIHGNTYNRSRFSCSLEGLRR